MLNTNTKFKYLTKDNLLFLAMVIIFCVFCTFIPLVSNGGSDLYNAFIPASSNLMNGISPYQEEMYYSPPWVAIAMIPLALMPYTISYVLFYLFNIFGFVYVPLKFKVNKILILVVLLFGGILYSQAGNLEGIVALGLILPPQIGLFFILAKPQIGIGIAIYWGFMALKKGGFKLAFWTFLPVSICFILSFLIFGNYMNNVVPVRWNFSIFPYGVPIGVILLVLSVWKNKLGFAIMSSPFLSPYLYVFTWVWVIFGFGVVLSEYKDKQITR